MVRRGLEPESNSLHEVQVTQSRDLELKKDNFVRASESMCRDSMQQSSRREERYAPADTFDKLELAQLQQI